MTDAAHRPYLIDRLCGRCLVPFEISEYREDGWIFVTYSCDRCGFRQVVTFSPAELEEWERRRNKMISVERREQLGLDPAPGGRG